MNAPLVVAETVFPVPLEKGFDYAVPDALAPHLKPGHRVLAPFGSRRAEVGVVVRLHDGADADFPLHKLKPLTSLLDPEPALSAQDLELAAWMSRRYFCGKGEAVFGVLPVGKMRPPKRGAAPRVLRESPASYGAPKPAALTEDQTGVLARLLPPVREKRFEAFLLQGVNASGKTEVYLHLIEEALARGRTAILLVPEIGLTPQTEAHLMSRFKTGVAVWHSELSKGERWTLWEDARAGKVRVVIGPRSALFLPLRDLGLIVLDEEHDSSYKSDSAPHYHARDTALEKGRLHGCPVVLGSATPSMESFQGARDGRLVLLRMTRRVGDRPFPTVTVVDMRKEKGWYMSDSLTAAMKDRLDKGEQSLLFLNRRGFATQVLCPACGWEARCPHCQVSLVYHNPMDADRKLGKEKPGELPFEKGDESPPLRCHTCDHRQAFPARCPTCRGDVLKYRGRGTQRVEGDLSLLFPKARVLRWDRDTTQKKASHHRAFQAVRSESIDIVVGTQMIAQGLDFPRVTLGGVLDADRSLRFPDFRAGEHAFQLLSQVAGRVGRSDGSRGETPGEVILQTRHPEHYAVRAAASFDYDAFAESELAFRREMGYPPFTRLAAAVLRSKDPAKAETAAAALVDHLEAAGLPDGCQALGPAPAFHHHREGFSHWQVLLKTPPDAMDRALPFLRQRPPPPGVERTVDVDPEALA